MRTLKYLNYKRYIEMGKTDLNEIPSEISLEYFADLVEKMRHHQRRYFATKNKEVLEQSKILERRVDYVIERMKDRQQSLFP